MTPPRDRPRERREVVSTPSSSLARESRGYYVHRITWAQVEMSLIFWFQNFQNGTAWLGREQLANSNWQLAKERPLALGHWAFSSAKEIFLRAGFLANP